MEPLPAWVVPRDRPVAKPCEEPVTLLLHDLQIHTQAEEVYYRDVKTLNNPTAVQHCSQFEATFDPEVEELLVHHVTLIRNGQEIPILETSGEIKLLQRETNLEAQMYDGTLSAVLLIPDVRVGDTLDYSFTRRRTRTVFPGKHWYQVDLSRTVDLAELHLYLRSPREDELKFKLLGGAKAPKGTNEGNDLIYELTLQNPAPQEPSVAAPGWYWELPVIQFSNFKTWGEIAHTIHQRWSTDAATDVANPYFQEALASLRQAEGNPEKLAGAAIWFVQNEIRYLSMAIGDGRLVPAPPSTVLQRRFGDCKDKVVLLNALLNTLGIPARPVLVSAMLGKAASDLLPSPAAFDHAITTYWIGNQQYFVDPTMSGQGGAPGTRYLGHFEWGLVIDEATSALTAIPSKNAEHARLEVFQEIQLNRNGSAKIQIKTFAHGAEADHLRAALHMAGKEQVTKDSRSRFQDIYEKATPVGDIVYQDHQVENVLTIEEAYQVPDLSFKPDPQSPKGYRAHALDIPGRLFPIPIEEGRKAPVSLPYPVHIIERITIQLPWRAQQNERARSTCSGFDFQFSAESNGNLLTLNFEYKNKREDLASHAIREYVRALDDVITGYLVAPGNLGRIPLPESNEPQQPVPDQVGTSAPVSSTRQPPPPPPGTARKPKVLVAVLAPLLVLAIGAGVLFFLGRDYLEEDLGMDMPALPTLTAAATPEEPAQEILEPSLIPQRTWTDRQGRSIVAELMEVEMNADQKYVGTFRMENGESIQVVIAQLKAGDIALIKHIMEREGMLEAEE